jgi:PEP-CTERM motif
LGERGVRNAEVEGSNPLPSTIHPFHSLVYIVLSPTADARGRAWTCGRRDFIRRKSCSQRATLALLLLALLLLAAPVEAVTLPITEGSVTFGCGGGACDQFAFFGGRGFEVSIIQPFCCGGPFGVIPEPTVNTIELFVSPGTGGGVSVRVGDHPPCEGIGEVELDCGFITVTTPGFHNPHMEGDVLTASTPFRAFGRLNVGPGFDLVGQGIAVHTDCGPCPGLNIRTDYTFRARVPEPATWLLALVGLGGLALRRVGDDRQPRRLTMSCVTTSWAPAAGPDNSAPFLLRGGASDGL